MIISQITSMNISVASRFSIREKQKHSVGISKDEKWSKYEIIYFPHQGIYYGYADSFLKLTGEHYIKDDFYSSDTRNPLLSFKNITLFTV